MFNRSLDNRSINNRFQSIVYVLIHFSCSIIQLACILAILSLQITLTITETCAFRIGVGFWSFPFLILSPISIWILLWKRNSLSCYLTFIFHICSTLFATSIILISFFALIELLCSSSNNYFFSINISLIAISGLLKLFLYAEIILIYFLQHHNNDPSILLDKEFQQKNYQIISNDKSWNSFRSIIKKN
jgi:hypothetical protein